MRNKRPPRSGTSISVYRKKEKKLLFGPSVHYHLKGGGEVQKGGETVSAARGLPSWDRDHESIRVWDYVQ